MRVGVLVIEIFIAGAASLKQKRRVLRSISDRARARFNVATSEVEHQDLHQRGTLAFASIASSDQALETLFDRLIDLASDVVPGGISVVEREILG